FFSCSSVAPPRALPSFPTRRSSDLVVPGLQPEARGQDSQDEAEGERHADRGEGEPPPAARPEMLREEVHAHVPAGEQHVGAADEDRKSTRLNSSHLVISYAVFCLKK